MVFDERNSIREVVRERNKAVMDALSVMGGEEMVIVSGEHVEVVVPVERLFIKAFAKIADSLTWDGCSAGYGVDFAKNKCYLWVNPSDTPVEWLRRAIHDAAGSVNNVERKQRTICHRGTCEGCPSETTCDGVGIGVSSELVEPNE